MKSKTQLRWKNTSGSDFRRGSAFAAEWDRLNAMRGNLPFLTSDSVACALQTLGDGKERLLVGHTSDGTVSAIVILTRNRSLSWQTFQPSQLPLGAWVAMPELELSDIGRDLMRGPLGACLVLSFTQVDPLVAPRPVDSDVVKVSNYIETGWIDIEGDFDSYWSARGKNLRQNMRKQRNKLNSEGIAVKMQVLQERSQMAGAVALYGELESAGWKEQQGTAVHPDNAQGRFYRELLEHACQYGGARVYQYLFDDRVVAMNICVLRSGTLVVLKTTYDESIRTFSPAFLLRETELQSFFSEGEIRRVEYFGRLMDWHTKFTHESRTLYHLTLHRWAIVKRLAAAKGAKGVNGASPDQQSTP